MHTAPKSILVVDDDPDILEFLRVILQDEGYSVVTSEKGEFLEQLQNDGLPDLILLDMLLSGKDGRELVKYLKREPETIHIPVIMISAHPGAEKSARQAGADDFLAKPFDLEVLVTKIAHFL